jgi:mannose-6-phosphate isomerase-like protein (cupin superfamily)
MSKPSYVFPITELTQANEAFRDEVLTGELSQLVLMTIQPGDDIGQEAHVGHDQILVFISGQGEALIDGQRHAVGPNDLAFVPSGAMHNFINTGSEPLKLWTIYSPPEHAAGTRHATKAEADAAEGHDH